MEDDKKIAGFLEKGLRESGFIVDVCYDGVEGLSLALTEEFDVAVMDIMLPLLDGLTVIEKMRDKEIQTPVLILSARQSVDDRVQGLQRGGDDYMVKPFNPNELIARLKVRLRRSSTNVEAKQLRIGDVLIDQVAHSIVKKDKVIPLTRLEFDLLLALAREPGRVFTREALLDEVWGYQNATDTRLVNVHVQRLRAKIEADVNNPLIIQTIRGVGYKAGA